MAAKKRARTREIPVTIRTGDLEVEDRLRDHIVDRIAARLARRGGSIHRVSVRLEDLNGPKNAPGIRCAVKVVIDRHESVMVEFVDVDPRTAFNRAIDAAERALRRGRERVRAVRRRAG